MEALGGAVQASKPLPVNVPGSARAPGVPLSASASADAAITTGRRMARRRSMTRSFDGDKYQPSESRTSPEAAEPKVPTGMPEPLDNAGAAAHSPNHVRHA